MKSKLIFFIFMLAIMLMILPAVNIIYNDRQSIQSTLQDKLSSLYNMDILESGIGYIGYKVGISTSPNKVYIGKEGWLFLGNKYSSPITEKNKGMDQENTKKIIALQKTFTLGLVSLNPME